MRFTVEKGARYLHPSFLRGRAREEKEELHVCLFRSFGILFEKSIGNQFIRSSKKNSFLLEFFHVRFIFLSSLPHSTALRRAWMGVVMQCHDLYHVFSVHNCFFVSFIYFFFFSSIPLTNSLFFLFPLFTKYFL